jgi:glyoxylase-like metal-dependent hydrolase (beta-lactamase superfamily II)
VANAYLVIGERPILVDTLEPGNERRILRALEQHNLEAKALALIVLTHGHWDHLGSVNGLREATGAPVALHGDDLELARAGQAKLRGVTPMGRASAGFFSSRRFAPVTPDIVLDGQGSLEQYGVHGRLQPTPGHTTGSVSVVLESGEALVADLVRGDFILEDRPTQHFFMDDLAVMRESIQSLLGLPLKRLYAGHGKPFSFESFQRRFE